MEELGDNANPLVTYLQTGSYLLIQISKHRVWILLVESLKANLTSLILEILGDISQFLPIPTTQYSVRGLINVSVNKGVHFRKECLCVTYNIGRAQGIVHNPL